MMQFNIEITDKTDEKDSTDNLISRTIAYTITKDIYSYEGSVTLTGADLQLSITKQKTLVKDTIRDMVMSIKIGLVSTNTILSNAEWNKSYSEDI